jgi:hypothetical protein
MIIINTNEPIHRSIIISSSNNNDNNNNNQQTPAAKTTTDTALTTTNNSISSTSSTSSSGSNNNIIIIIFITIVIMIISIKNFNTQKRPSHAHNLQLPPQAAALAADAVHDAGDVVELSAEPLQQLLLVAHSALDDIIARAAQPARTAEEGKQRKGHRGE